MLSTWYSEVFSFSHTHLNVFCEHKFCFIGVQVFWLFNARLICKKASSAFSCIIYKCAVNRAFLFIFAIVFFMFQAFLIWLRFFYSLYERVLRSFSIEIISTKATWALSCNQIFHRMRTTFENWCNPILTTFLTEF